MSSVLNRSPSIDKINCRSTLDSPLARTNKDFTIQGCFVPRKSAVYKPKTDREKPAAKRAGLTLSQLKAKLQAWQRGSDLDLFLLNLASQPAQAPEVRRLCEAAGVDHRDPQHQLLIQLVALQVSNREAIQDLTETLLALLMRTSKRWKK